MEDAKKFLTRYRPRAMIRKTPFKPGKHTMILENCLVIQNGKMKQVNLKKGKIKNYRDTFDLDAGEIDIKFALGVGRHEFPLPMQRKSVKVGDRVEVNVAVWGKNDTKGVRPDEEDTFMAQVIRVGYDSFTIKV